MHDRPVWEDISTAPLRKAAADRRARRRSDDGSDRNAAGIASERALVPEASLVILVPGTSLLFLALLGALAAGAGGAASRWAQYA
jgi:hypothetical protein